MAGAIKLAIISMGKFIVIVAAVSAGLWVIQKIWQHITEDTNEAENALEGYNEAMDKLIAKRDKLEKLKAEKDLSPEERVDIAKETILIDNYTAALSRRMKAEDKQERLRREKEGGTKKKGVFRPEIREEQARVKSEIARLEKSLAMDRATLERESPKSGKRGPMDTLFLTGVEASIQSAEEQLILLRKRVKVTQDMIDKENALAKAIEERNNSEKGMKKFLENMAKAAVAASERIREIQKFVTGITKDPQAEYELFARKLQKAAEMGIFLGNVQEELNKKFAESPMGIKEQGKKDAFKATTKEIGRLQDALDLATGKVSKIDLRMKQFKEAHPEANESQLGAARSLMEQTQAEEERKKALKEKGTGLFPEAGRYGFTEIANRIQDALLKKDDPQRTLVAQGAFQNTLLEKIEKNTEKRGLV